MSSEIVRPLPEGVTQVGVWPNGKPRYAFTEHLERPITLHGVYPHGKINTHDAPYEFNLDAPKLVKLMQTEYGFTPEEIGRVEVHIIGEGKMSEIEPNPKERKLLFPEGNPIRTFRDRITQGDDGLIATTNVEGDRILLIFYPNFIWWLYKSDRRAIVSFLGHKERFLSDVAALDQKTTAIRVTEKRIGYMDRAKEPSSSFKRLDRLIEAIVNRDSRQDPIHEIAHLKERLRNHKNFPNSTIILKLLYFLSRFNNSVYKFLEDYAEKEEERVAKKSDWFGLVSFRINSDYEH